MTDDPDRLGEAVATLFDDDVLPALREYIAIPALSPGFDADWASHGAIRRAAELLVGFARRRAISGLEIEVVEIPGKSPVVIGNVPATADDDSGTVLLYGHLDKQPPLGSWREGLDPFVPVEEGDRLYGRGAADDGYAGFCALAAIEALERSGTPHGRLVVLVESGEESGSPDLESYLDHLADRIGTPSLVICLDSGCVTYDRLWVTTSLRGLVTGTVHIEVMREGVHSGHAGGVVPSPARLLRLLLDRIENAETGDVVLAELAPVIPTERQREIDQVAGEFGDEGAGVFPLLGGVEREGRFAADRIARGTWHPAVAVIGVDGLPATAEAGNVAIGALAVKLAVRVPPNVDADLAGAALQRALESAPPAGAYVRFELEQCASGWDAPPLDQRTAAAVESASRRRFGRGPGSIGLGGSIPFLGVLGARYPGVHILATGVLGPESNAHGPNEFLHLPTARAVTAVVADVIGDLA